MAVLVALNKDEAQAGRDIFYEHTFTAPDWCGAWMLAALGHAQQPGASSMGCLHLHVQLPASQPANKQIPLLLLAGWLHALAHLHSSQ